MAAPPRDNAAANCSARPPGSTRIFSAPCPAFRRDCRRVTGRRSRRLDDYRPPKGLSQRADSFLLDAWPCRMPLAFARCRVLSLRKIYSAAALWLALLTEPHRLPWTPKLVAQYHSSV